MLRMLLVEAAQIAVRFDPGLRKAAPKNTDRIILSLTPPSLLSRGSLSSGGVSEIKNARLQAVCLPPSVGRCRRDQGAWQVTSLTPTFTPVDVGPDFVLICDYTGKEVVE